MAAFHNSQTKGTAIAAKEIMIGRTPNQIYNAGESEKGRRAVFETGGGKNREDQDHHQSTPGERD
jgi:hypothetical protein